MPVDITKLDDHQLVRLIDNRWKEGDTLWSTIHKVSEKNKKQWQNLPDWLEKIPTKKSKARDNRIFVAVETVVNTLTGRPSKPNVIPGNSSEESAKVADDLQEFYLAKYRDLGMKTKMRRGLRFLFFSRLVVFKVFWNPLTDDFDTKPVNPNKVRFSPDSSKSDWAIEEVDDTALDLIDKFPEKKAEILKRLGFSDENELMIKNPKIKYKEAWIGVDLAYTFKGTVLKTEKNPYWDWGGLIMSKDEKKQWKGVKGKRRRALGTKLKNWNPTRQKLKKAGKTSWKDKKGNIQEYADSVKFNHFEKPKHPYIYGTIFGEEDKVIGETSLIEQAAPLQGNVDERKRQFSDNAKMANGTWKVDTNLATGITKAEAQKAKADPQGIIYGAGVKEGVMREVGKPLPAFLRDDMLHSIAEIDNIFGTQPTFRGEKGGGSETATGRAILREESYKRLDELIDLVDTLHEQIYNWWFQMIVVRYTEQHFIKPIGATKASETIDLVQEDIDEGTVIKVIPGQVIPEDRLFKADRATEAAEKGLIDPLSYFEITDWEDPMKQAKRLEMYKLNPLSILDMTDKEAQQIIQANEFLQGVQTAGGAEGEGGAGAGGGEGGVDPKAQKVAQIRQQIEQVTQSPEFQNLPPAEQRSQLVKMRQQLAAVSQT